MKYRLLSLSEENKLSWRPCREARQGEGLLRELLRTQDKAEGETQQARAEAGVAAILNWQDMGLGKWGSQGNRNLHGGTSTLPCRESFRTCPRSIDLAPENLYCRPVDQEPKQPTVDKTQSPDRRELPGPLSSGKT